MSPLARAARGGTFAAENRRITFNSRRFLRYYVGDVLSPVLGPLVFLVGVPVWGVTAARSMKYLPNNKTECLFTVLFGPVFQLLFLTPLVQGGRVLTGTASTTTCCRP